MLNIVPELIERYCQSHSQSESKLFRALTKETYAKAHIPQMSVGHLEGAFLRLLVRVTRAKRILEIGTFTGYSALAMAEALPDNGKLITCDIDPVATSIANRSWAQSPHGRKIQLKLGPAADTIKKLQGDFDLVFIDADKTNYINYWKLCVPKVRRGGILAADNALWSGRVLNPQDEDSRAIDAFNKHVHADKRVEATLVTIRDGLMLAWKK